MCYPSGTMATSFSGWYQRMYSLLVGKPPGNLPNRHVGTCFHFSQMNKAKCFAWSRGASERNTVESTLKTSIGLGQGTEK